VALAFELHALLDREVKLGDERYALAPETIAPVREERIDDAVQHL
jgi:hypothetical protein